MIATVPASLQSVSSSPSRPLPCCNSSSAVGRKHRWLLTQGDRLQRPAWVENLRGIPTKLNGGMGAVEGRLELGAQKKYKAARSPNQNVCNRTGAQSHPKAPMCLMWFDLGWMLTSLLMDLGTYFGRGFATPNNHRCCELPKAPYLIGLATVSWQVGFQATFHAAIRLIGKPTCAK